MRGQLFSLLTSVKQMARFRNVVWTWNNPTGLVEFDEEKMGYLVYQEEIGDSGTYHFQGYCEFKEQMRQAAVKELLGGRTVHVAPRFGSQDEAIEYCKREFNEDGSDKRIPGTEVIEFGVPNAQGKRVDLEAFKDAVLGGAKRRDLIGDHFGTIARYPRFYETLNQINRPQRSEELVVTLLIGDTGTGKTRYVEEKFGKDADFWRSPLTNGSMWFDGYDGHSIVLLDDFAGRASHFTLCALLQLLDVSTISVPIKGGHTWWSPSKLFITTNILPRDWYDWKNRGEQYRALARRIHRVFLHYLPLSDTDCGYIEQDRSWWAENSPSEANWAPLRCPMTGVVMQ